MFTLMFLEKTIITSCWIYVVIILLTVFIKISHALIKQTAIKLDLTVQQKAMLFVVVSILLTKIIY